VRVAAIVAFAVTATLTSNASASIAIARGGDAVTVTTGDAQFVISTRTFDVVHAASVKGVARLGPGRVTVDALGSPTTFGPPSEVTSGGDWVELRGWAEAKKHLWYIARYQFFDGKPYARLVLTLTDRHDTSPAAVQSDRYWQNRLLAHWRLELGAGTGTPVSYTQQNSYSFSTGAQPWVEVVSVSGSPYEWVPRDPPVAKTLELIHDGNAAANQIVWHPMVDGAAELTAVVTPFSGGSEYLAAKAVTYEVVDAGGAAHAITADQRKGDVKLGRFTLSKNSVVRLKATGGDKVVAGPLRVAPAAGKPYDIPFGQRFDGVLTDGPLTIAVKDFWQHHPMTVFRTPTTIGWQAIERPEEYTGGMGLTIETMIAIDGPRAAAVAALYAPPSRTVPLKLHPVDGSLAHGAIGDRYDALLKIFAAHYRDDLERLDSFGWRNWGDYQIGGSYTDKGSGTPIEDWANLQYDLPNGLLIAWLRTGDPDLWRVAQASVRHLMDMDLVKFGPFEDKLNGLVYRKGEMPRRRSHIDAEPITDQGFAFRSLMLYWQLTGESWARDLAKQNIDRLVYYAVTRPHFVLNGGRPTAWMLRAALAGAEWFPKDPANYQLVADAIVRQLVDYWRANKRLPGRQPVWQAQMVEGLAEYQRRTTRTDVIEVIVGEVRHLLNEAVRRRPDGGFDFMYCYPGLRDCGDTWTDEQNYAFLWLSSVAYAYKLSNDPFFAKWADQLFAFGEAKMRDHRDTRSWTSALAFPHAFVELSGHK
jgi:hypothetical protein